MIEIAGACTAFRQTGTSVLDFEESAGAQRLPNLLQGSLLAA